MFLKKTFFITGAKIVLLLGTAGIGIVAFLFFYYGKDLPRPQELAAQDIVQPTRIYDRTGVLLYEIYKEERRDPVPLEEVSPHVIHAVVATEDDAFYEHPGVDISGILRAALENLREGGISEGGSTITQQMVRNAFLSTDRTIERKIKETIITVDLERKYSKDDILEAYLNQVPLGPNIYGIGTASRSFFGKPASELTLEESAIIAAVIRAPSFYSPYGPNWDRLMSRKDFVLDRMAEEGYITQQEAAEAKERALIFEEFERQNIKAPHFVLYVIDQLVEKYGEDFLQRSGLRVHTSLDWELQQEAERIVSERSERNAQLGAQNAALTAIDPSTGEILAMVGSRDWFEDPYPADCIPGRDCLLDPKVNIAISYPGRQPGSAFKPFVYATAFSKGYSGETTVIDELTNFGVWGGKEYIPQNYDGKFRGEVTLRQALAQSLNIPAVKVLRDFAGIEDSIATARRMGITTLDRGPSFYGLSLVLGGGEVRLLDITSAYGAFANNGRLIPPVSITKVENSTGTTISEPQKTAATVISPEAAQTITDILSDNNARTPVFGPRSSLYINDSVAVKTGTTQEYKDAWTIGYSSDIVVGVWAGNNNGTPSGYPGATLAAPIWSQFMRFALSNPDN